MMRKNEESVTHTYEVIGEANSVLAAAVSGKLTEAWRRGNAFKEDAVLLGSLISESSGHKYFKIIIA